ncbi:MAG: hypothetical protein HZA92_18995 [Verrucomicrobia bacterium]|nr:hypothetical protein [Verrucomicrobiota bacterium]
MSVVPWAGGRGFLHRAAAARCEDLIGTGCDAAYVERWAHEVDFRVALETGIGTEFR